MDTYTNDMAPLFNQLLERREAELRALVRGANSVDRQRFETSGEVMDFKDFASEESQAVVDEAQATRALHELELVLAARTRLRQKTFGECLGCGNPIDLRRLTALPFTPYCSACQSIQERHQAHP